VRPHGLDGSGTHLYVFDSGVDKNHHDFGSRVVAGANTRVPGKPIPADEGFDCHGHGTFQAGALAARVRCRCKARVQPSAVWGHLLSPPHW
jgi:subtilisin family serine protease